nr:MAG TPA: hypothetical protein [Caudoviricetes sp.]
MLNISMSLLMVLRQDINVQKVMIQEKEKLLKTMKLLLLRLITGISATILLLKD